jgi:hypothetical protein
MRHLVRGRTVAALAVLALTIAVPVALAHEGHGHEMTGTMPAPADGVSRSTFTSVWQVGGSGVSGMAGVRQKGRTLVVTLVVSGLEPRSRHAAHVHGPLASCRKTTKRHAAELGDLVANAQGVIHVTRRVKVEEMVVGMPGYFLMVHANPGKKLPSGAMAVNPPIACGTLPA